MSLATQRVHRLIWSLIFGGLVALGLGVELAHSNRLYGWTFIGGGGVAVAGGVLLVWVRSRMPDD